MFKIGDIVKNIQLGPSITGQIVSIFDKGVYCHEQQLNIWTDRYKEWKSKPVYGVRLDQQSKSVTLKEWLKYGNSKENYSTLKEHGVLAYPEDDLIKISE